MRRPGQHFARACELEPEEGQHYYNLASLERYLGNREAAEAALERCIECRPGDADAHLMRAGLQDQTAEQNNIESLLDAYELTRDTPRDRLRVCYALAKELEDIADYDRAFKYLEEGSTLRRKAMQYTPAKDLRAIEMIRETFSREVIERDIEGHISAEPIFVIGMPRTGTTLVERILSSHSVVRSAGESKAFAVQLVSECSKVEDRPPDDVGDLITRSIDVDFAALGEGYVNEARPVGERVAHFVDKMPLNFLYAGLIHQALPKARIVLLERDPMDTCLCGLQDPVRGCISILLRPRRTGQLLRCIQATCEALAGRHAGRDARCSLRGDRDKPTTRHRRPLAVLRSFVRAELSRVL